MAPQKTAKPTQAGAPANVAEKPVKTSSLHAKTKQKPALPTKGTLSTYNVEQYATGRRRNYHYDGY